MIKTHTLQKVLKGKSTVLSS